MSHLGMFAKYWQAGRVKTRLAVELGEQLAADLYLVFLQHLMTNLQQCCDRRTLVFSPVETGGQFQSKFGDTWAYRAQSEGDLGDRLADFLRWSASQTEGGGKVLLIGSDTPHLAPSLIVQAEQRLDHSPVVLGPSQDGGYYLLGLDLPSLPPGLDLFAEMPWSTDQVWEETVKRLDRHELPYGRLPALLDVDDGEDLKELLRELDQSSDPEEHRLREALNATLSGSRLGGQIE
ncbi:MAG: TIGR04282 family arsenosugar biosynthesis glycosyltransferase [Mariniblastus sp.]|nr:TIGR04282 family arsenosugar biosynthesis glycosyltransferase [Mariniblastus sp.]